MLKFMRDKSRSSMVRTVMWIVVASFVGTIFVVWGARGEFSRSNILAVVNGEALTYNEFNTIYDQTLQQYRNAYKERWDPALARQLNLPEQTFDLLIDRKLRLSVAKRLALGVSDREVADAIGEQSYFQGEDGAFDRPRYLNVLRQNNIAPQMYEESQREELRLGKLEELFMRSVKVSEEEVRREYARQKETVSIEYVTFDPTGYQVDDPAEEELKAYYDEHPEEFQTAQKIAIQYIAFLADQYRDQVTLTEEEIEEYYEARKDTSYTFPAQVQARHILVKVGPEADDATKRALRDWAEALLFLVKERKLDFATVAKLASEDPGSAPSGGDLGFFGKGRMVKPFEEAAFSMESGEISDLVESPFGFHIIKVEEALPGYVQPMAEAREGIINYLTLEASRGLALEEAQQFAFDAAGTTFEEDAQAYGLSAVTSDSFARGEPVPGLADSADLSAAAWAREVGEVTDPAPSGVNYYVARVLDRKEPQLKPFEEVQQEVKEKIVGQRRNEKARQTAEEARAAVLAGAMSFDELGSRYGHQVSASRLFTRSEQVPPLSADPDFMRKAFGLRPGDVAIALADGTAHLMRLVEKPPIDEAPFATERAVIESNLREKRARQLLHEWSEQWRSAADIRLSRSLPF